jgi:hypothetical protein
MSNRINLGYDVKDFLYNKPEYSSLLKNYKENCKKESCNKVSDHKDCMEIEICKNKENVEILNEMERHHTGANERYENTQYLYNVLYIDFINLIMGICVTGYVSYTIYKLRK